MKTISFQLVQQKPRTLAFFVWNTKATISKEATRRHIVKKSSSFRHEDRRRRRSGYLALLGELGVRVVWNKVDEVLKQSEIKHFQLDVALYGG